MFDHGHPGKKNMGRLIGQTLSRRRLKRKNGQDGQKRIII